MDISAIIPTLNEASCIASAIDRAWDLAVAEVIVVDGGSRDGTLNIAEGRPCRVVSAPTGRGTQLNRGARAARGDVLLFLHADTWLAPRAGGEIRRAVVNPRFVAGAFAQRIEACGLQFRMLEKGNALRVRLFGMAYGDQGIFIRRDVFEQIGGFPDTPLLEDVALMQRLRAVGRPRLLPGPIHISARRWQKNGVVRQTLRNWLIVIASRCGVSPQRLLAYYPPHE